MDNNGNGNPPPQPPDAPVPAAPAATPPPADDRPIMNAPVVESCGARSKTSTHQSYIRFINQTQRRVDVTWINYEGVRVKYTTLEPSEHFDITSFVSHPWIFLDAETHSKLVTASSAEVYDVPPPRLVRLRGGEIRPTRAHVNIRLPVYSLRECALQAVQRCLQEPQDAYELAVLPSAVQRELFQRCSLGWVNPRRS